MASELLAAEARAKGLPLSRLLHSDTLDRMAKFCRLLAFIAVLLMPLGMTAAPASVAGYHEASASMPMEHCPDPQKDHRKAGFSLCTMACAAALPAIDHGELDFQVLARTSTSPAIAQRLRGVHPETATPPPRSS